MKTCPYCAEEIQEDAIKCKHCGSMLTEDGIKALQPSKPSLRPLAILGYGIMIVAVFAPFVQAPIVGSVSYFNNGESIGILVIIFGALALLLALSKTPDISALPALVGIGVTCYSIYNVLTAISEAKADYMVQMADNPFAGLGEGLMQAMQLEWGGIVIIAGGLLGIGASMTEGKRLKAK